MATTMRAKMKLVNVTRTEAAETLKFSAVGSKTGYLADGSDEANTYARFTPAAQLEMVVANPALFGQFNPGEEYFLDFTPA